MDDEERGDEDEAEDDPAQPGEEGAAPAVARRLVVLGGPELLGLQPQADEEDGDGEGAEGAERVDPLLTVRLPAILRTARTPPGDLPEPTASSLLPSFCFSSSLRLR